VVELRACVDDVETGWKMLSKLPGTRVSLHDRALLLVGFAAFRRSELVSLDVADLEFSSAGLVVTLRRANNDPEGSGRSIGIPFGSSKIPARCAR
jgi:hypothetical protein